MQKSQFANILRLIELDGAYTRKQEVFQADIRISHQQQLQLFKHERNILDDEQIRVYFTSLYKARDKCGEIFSLKNDENDKKVDINEITEDMTIPGL
jgi:hypothetical protein